MLNFIFNCLLKYKNYILISIIFFLFYAAYQSTKHLKIGNQINKLLPVDHQASIFYRDFQNKFGEDGNNLFISIPRDLLFSDVKHFNNWEMLRRNIELETVISSEEQINPFEVIISETNLKKLVINEKEKIFDLESFSNTPPLSTEELNNIRNEINTYPFYKGLIYSDTSRNKQEHEISLIFIQVKNDVMNSDLRGNLIERIEEKVRVFKKEYPETKLSGLGFIRMDIKNKIKKEINIFISLSILIMSFILFFFFKSWRILSLCLTVVGMSVLFGIGIITELGYELTGIMGLLPSLLIAISIPNCIYYINFLQSMQIKYKDQKKALKETFIHLVKISFITNATTALGFFVFISTKNQVLSEFGIATGLSILMLFLISNIILTLGFYQMSEIKIEENRILNKFIDSILHYISSFQKKNNWKIYSLFFVLLIISFIGISKIESTASFTDDLSEKDEIKKEFRYFEKHFLGVIPIDIYIQSKKKINKESDFQKIDSLQSELAKNHLISRSLSVVDLTKYLRQAFYDGNPEDYKIIKNKEKIFFDEYIQNTKNKFTTNENQIQKNKTKNIVYFFIDSSQTKTRISMNIKDLNSKEIKEITKYIQQKIDDIYPEKTLQNIQLTGSSILNLLGTDYLTENLIFSLLLSILMISLIVFNLFKSYKITLISIIPNLIPLFFTAGLMGYLGIPIKPSTLLIFSIVFGISIDDSIHFLSKYKLEILSRNNLNPIQETIKKTGKSMITTSIILFFGFIIFTVSNFGSTSILGILISFTIIIALISNLTILPYLLKLYKKSV
jgi:predicted RND superfamily exporter protein